MRRFVLNIICFGFVFVLLVAAMHLTAVCAFQRKVDRDYQIAPERNIVFIGSSQVGCAIEENAVFSNRVIWVNATTPICWLMNLKELERRNWLKSVKKVVVPYNLIMPLQLYHDAIAWDWYHELPISFRYMSMLPLEKLSFIWYVARNQRFPFKMESQSILPMGRPAISSYDSKCQERYRAGAIDDAKGKVLGKGCLDGWKDLLFGAYEQMSEVCKKNGVDFVIYRQPVLDVFYDNLSLEFKMFEKSFYQRMESLGIKVLYMPESLGAESFFDVVHMSDDGRMRFTNDIMCRLRGM